MIGLNTKRMKSMKISSLKEGAFLSRSGRGSVVYEKQYSKLETMKARRLEKKLNAIFK